MTRLSILIMAGGTGGHVFPALAVADEMRRLGHRISWLGSVNGMESKFIPGFGYEMDLISVKGLRGNGIAGWLLAPFKLTQSLFQSLAVMKRRKPDFVLGMGGFVTGPGAIAARLTGIPLMIHEQNAIVGMTNRLLAPLAARVMQAFPHTFAEKHRALTTGNPVRNEIIDIPEPQLRTKDSTRLRILVVGGSLGAHTLNTVVPEAISKIDKTIRPVVRHQCGEKHLELTKAAYSAVGVESEVLPFIADIASSYRWADLVICRSGALTVSELAAVGIASILVPFPYAVDDHQYHNALYLEKGNAAVIKRNNEFTPQWLSAYLQPLCADLENGRNRLLAMAMNGRALARTSATQEVVGICFDSIYHKEGHHG